MSAFRLQALSSEFFQIFLSTFEQLKIKIYPVDPSLFHKRYRAFLTTLIGLDQRFSLGFFVFVFVFVFVQ